MKAAFSKHDASIDFDAQYFAHLLENLADISVFSNPNNEGARSSRGVKKAAAGRTETAAKPMAANNIIETFMEKENIYIYIAL